MHRLVLSRSRRLIFAPFFSSRPGLPKLGRAELSLCHCDRDGYCPGHCKGSRSTGPDSEAETVTHRLGLRAESESKSVRQSGSRAGAPG